MSGLVLRTVNSSFFGLRAKIRSIHHAVNLMGMSQHDFEELRDELSEMLIDI